MAFELLKLKQSCDCGAAFLDPARARPGAAALPCRCRGALWHRPLATDEAVSSMYRGLLDSRPPPHEGRPFTGEPPDTMAGRRGVFWVVLGCHGSSSRSCSSVHQKNNHDAWRRELVQTRRVAAEDAPGIVDAFRRAARKAIDAGFDSVELQCTNGYFVDDDGGPESATRWRWCSENLNADC